MKSTEQLSTLVDEIRGDDYLKAKDTLQGIVNTKISNKIAEKGVDVLKQFKGSQFSES
jgi:hypothetical protein